MDYIHTACRLIHSLGSVQKEHLELQFIVPMITILLDLRKNY